MKKIILLMSLVSIFLLGLAISYAEVKRDTNNNGYKQMLNTFENINSEFKFYNIKGNTYLNRNLNENEMKSICMDIITNLGLEESQIEWIKNKNSSESQVYAHIQESDRNISIIAVNKSNNESYIMVDILENKVYKDIVDIYTVLEETLSNFSNKVDIYTCIAGEYKKRLQLYKYDDILDKILYNMNAKEIDRVEDENFVSVTAFSKEIKTDYLEYLGNKVNLNIGIRYSENEEKTMIYVATPIIRLDY
ncbi:YwmB family TATA-box binding protein [Paraclostridium bifermentans]|uniref:YwmB family TATA-box binding protein n=1 Tax=Paraclostridium bifermentans TaxID=1490 RepID=UPI00359C3D9B